MTRGEAPDLPGLVVAVRKRMEALRRVEAKSRQLLAAMGSGKLGKIETAAGALAMALEDGDQG